MPQTQFHRSRSELLARALSTRTKWGLGVAWLTVALFSIGGDRLLHAGIGTSSAIGLFALLFGVILFAAFSVVGVADELAHQLGEPYGTLVLTISIVVIEVVLISAMMMGPGETATIGRDSMFAVLMLILNLVAGICLLFGGLKFGEQEYNAQGAVSYISMILVLTGVAFVLPNFLPGAAGEFSTIESFAVISIVSAVYVGFIAAQLKWYRRLFLQPDRGQLSVPFRDSEAPTSELSDPSESKSLAIMRSLVLLMLVIPIVLLAHHLAVLIDIGIDAVNAPVAVGGLLIAVIVFTPESFTAVKAALAGEKQRSMNLYLGACVSTFGLTVPAVLVIGLITGNPVVLGLGAVEISLLVISLALGALSFIGQRTSPIQGLIHIALFAFYVVFLFSGS